MSKTLLSIMIEELTTVRLICRKESCSAVVEFPMENLDSKDMINCPFCGSVFQGNKTTNLKDLAIAVRELKKHTQQLGIEFIIPAKEGQ